MKKIERPLLFLPLLLLLTTLSCRPGGVPKEAVLTPDELLDKIKGGWAGQTIGCTFGGPTEFRYTQSYIPDYVDIRWPDGYIRHYFDSFPGLYDDVYMDLTFLDVFDRLGLEAPVDSFAHAFAHAGYMLWAANQAARYNILNGIRPPASGHWLNNPHADDIDYQIEADFAGLMSPGMPNAASQISDSIGHIMNYGNGWYGGVYVGALYALAFVLDDVETIVSEALKTIPEQSTFHTCISDVIRWHEQYPGDWKKTWYECHRKWDDDKGSPNGVFAPYNIDALLNSAYVTIGLLYGGGDFSKTLDISTRCGQDSDCNPATAGGIVGTMLGYDRIPEYWMKNLREVEDTPFAYTTISLNRAYRMSYDLALRNIERNGGSVGSDRVVLACQQPQPVRFEACFTGHYPIEKRVIGRDLQEWNAFSFDGVGFAMTGYVHTLDGDSAYEAEVAFYLDDELIETPRLPADEIRRRDELFWRYQLPEGRHTVRLEWINPQPNARIDLFHAVIYGSEPRKPLLHP